ncbi:aminotransferase [Candidatus Peregrinibacteria bacterium CG10_big_fil_rev_8_21_14_0_10_36_19]|nr:MAG: aminotransferase [Candidatus Peregrinibacteria bacterium CG10_big_fil_rev_8_21_14_0_10_36_19]
MRTKLSNPNVDMLKYGIREIVDVAQKLGEIDPNFKFIGENIGDPIAKSWPVPDFLKELIIEEVKKPGDKAFGYSHSRGLPSTRHWVVDYSKRFSPSSTLDYEYVLFVSGLGAGIAAMYHMLPKGSRIIQPTPSYPTHASLESFNAGEESISYNLDPNNGWQPDLEHLESQIQKYPEIAGILIINPNNPTGGVYTEETLEKLVQLAEKYDLMLISDEIYFRLVFNGQKYVQLTEIAQGRVPLIVMRGLSKDVPWPGGRCGWLEFHNVDLDPEYKDFAEAVKKRVLMEVCSVSLPQHILPQIYDHPKFEAWIQTYTSELEKNANYIADILSSTPGLKVQRINGAFYMMPLFEDGVLKPTQTLHIENEEARKFIESQVNVEGFPLDKRFAYYLLATTGICVVPASGFFSPYYGFRLTTLDRDDKRRQETYSKVSQAVKDYLSS